MPPNSRRGPGVADAANSTPSLWQLALAGLGAILVGIGLCRFAYTPLVPVLIEEGWLSEVEAAFLGAANLVGYLVGAVLARKVAAVQGEARAIRFMLLLCVVSLVACALPSTMQWFVPWRFAAGFAGAVLMVLAGPVILSHVPAHRWGLISGIIYTGVGLGIAASGTLVPLLSAQSPEIAWLGVAAIAAMLTAAGWSSWRDPPSPLPSPSPSSSSTTVKKLSAGGAFMLLVASYAMDAVGYVPHTIFWVDYITRDLGLGVGVGGLCWTVFGVSAMVTPSIAGWLADRLGAGPTLTGAYLLKSAAIALPLFYQSLPVLIVSSIVVGGLVPGVVVLASSQAAGLSGREHQRKAWWWMTLAFSFAQATASYGMSMLFEATGSYPLLFTIGAIALFVAAILASPVLSRWLKHSRQPVSPTDRKSS